MIIVQGKKFPFSSLNANDLDRFEAAFRAYPDKMNAARRHAAKTHLSSGDSLRAVCRVVLDLIDATLGAGASAQLGLDENTCDKALICWKEMIEAVGVEQKSFREMFQPPAAPAPAPQNRAQRRKQKKHKPHRRSEGFHPEAVVSPNQQDAHLEHLIFQQAANLKAERRAELMRELAALDND